MARKESITIDMILDTAFDMVKEEGFESVTARRVAAAVGCSTQPIFRVYKNMEELQKAVYDRAIAYFLNYYDAAPKPSRIPFVNLGLAYIVFAKSEKNYFKLLFVEGIDDGMPMFDLLNGEKGNVVSEITRAKLMGCADPADMFMRMWIFVHGAAAMTLTGDYDLSDEETIALLEKTFTAFARSKG